MISILIAAALLAQQTSTPVAMRTRVAGRVIDSLSGEAVPKVTVILRARDEEQAQSYADETDSRGTFSFDDVNPGECALVAERPGFVAETTGATGAPPPDIKVEKGKPLNDVRIRLTPLGVITGRVLDADGDPVRGAVVNALRYVYNAGKRQLRTTDSTETGDNGEFRMFGLRAGTFYLKVTRGNRFGKQLEQGISTYYPGTIDESHAAPIELRAGAQLAGFDIRLQSTGLYSVSFEFADGAPPEAGWGAYLMNEQGVQMNRVVTFSPTGLAFRGVPPGSYDAAVSVAGDGKPHIAIKHVEVVSADVDGGALTFLSPVELAGSVRVEGGAFSGLDRVQINLRAGYRMPLMGNTAAPVQADGAFLVPNATPAVYELAINRVPGVYLKSVRLGDKVVPDRRIDLASKLEKLIVVLGADVGEVEGSVQNAKGDPVVRARVNAIADGDQANRTDFNRFTFTNQKGEFKIKDVPPGEYKIFAWEDVPVGAPQDPEFRKPFEKQAASIRMQPNGHEKVSVTAISAAQVAGSSQ